MGFLIQRKISLVHVRVHQAIHAAIVHGDLSFQLLRIILRISPSIGNTAPQIAPYVTHLTKLDLRYCRALNFARPKNGFVKERYC